MARKVHQGTALLSFAAAGGPEVTAVPELLEALRSDKAPASLTFGRRTPTARSATVTEIEVAPHGHTGLTTAGPTQKATSGGATEQPSSSSWGRPPMTNLEPDLGTITRPLSEFNDHQLRCLFKQIAFVYHQPSTITDQWLDSKVAAYRAAGTPDAFAMVLR